MIPTELKPTNPPENTHGGKTHDTRRWGLHELEGIVPSERIVRGKVSVHGVIARSDSCDEAIPCFKSPKNDFSHLDSGGCFVANNAPRNDQGGERIRGKLIDAPVFLGNPPFTEIITDKEIV